MALPIQWTWVWVNCGCWWWTERPIVLQSGHRVGHDWATELNWTVASQAPLSMGFFQARILEWVAIPFSRGSSQAADWTWSSALQANALPSELPGKQIKALHDHYGKLEMLINMVACTPVFTVHHLHPCPLPYEFQSLFLCVWEANDPLPTWGHWAWLYEPFDQWNVTRSGMQLHSRDFKNHFNLSHYSFFHCPSQISEVSLLSLKDV